MRGLRSALHSLLNEFADRCSALTVYIAEAHAVDEWRLDGSVKIKQPSSTAERLRVAEQFAATLHWQTPLLIDPPEKEMFEQLFAPWPLRFFIVSKQTKEEKGKGQPLTLAYVAEPVGETFDLCELREQIERAIGIAAAADSSTTAVDQVDQPMRA